MSKNLCGLIIVNIIILFIWYNYIKKCTSTNDTTKEYAYKTLSNVIRMPKQLTLYKPIKILPKGFRFPIVLKPDDGSKGHNVYTNIMDNSHLYVLSKLLLNENKRIIMENQIMNMRECRILIDKRLNHFSIMEKKYITVTGNGINTIHELSKKKSKTKSDKRFSIKLDKNIVNINDIPIKGQTIIVNYKRNASLGADGSYINPKIVHPDNIKLFYTLLDKMNNYKLGIDLLFHDLSISHTKSPIMLIEVNACPGFDKKRLFKKEFKTAITPLYVLLGIVNLTYMLK
jgi:glutathione synthase/RimK-type ligase-like ATP-grasp enzyme